MEIMRYLILGSGAVIGATLGSLYGQGKKLTFDNFIRRAPIAFIGLLAGLGVYWFLKTFLLP